MDGDYCTAFVSVFFLAFGYIQSCQRCPLVVLQWDVSTSASTSLASTPRGSLDDDVSSYLGTPGPYDPEPFSQGMLRQRVKSIVDSAVVVAAAEQAASLREFDEKMRSMMTVARRNSELDPSAYVQSVLNLLVELGILDTYIHASGVKRWFFPTLNWDVITTIMQTRPEWKTFSETCYLNLQGRMVMHYAKQLLDLTRLFDSSNVRTALHMLNNDLHIYRVVVEECKVASKYAKDPNNYDLIAAMLQLIGCGSLLRTRFGANEVRFCVSVCL